MFRVLMAIVMAALACDGAQGQTNWVVKKRTNGTLYTWSGNPSTGFAVDEVTFSGNSVVINPSGAVPANQSVHEQEWFISRSSSALDIEDVDFTQLTDGWGYRVTVGEGWTNPPGTVSHPNEWSGDRLNPVIPGAHHLRNFRTDFSARQAWRVDGDGAFYNKT